MTQQRKQSRGSRRRPVVESLEPRILYSADFAPGLVDESASLPQTEQRTLDSSGEFAPDLQVQQAQQRREIVFVDTATPDYEKLVEDIRDRDGGRVVEVVLLQDNSSGIDQITRTLAEREDLSAVHIISHGSDGAMRLGSSTLDFDALLENASKIKGWGGSLTADADVLIYGCNVAQTDAGRSLVDALSRLTGADVAASEDATGAAALGGDWDLEYRSGTVQVPLAVSQLQQAEWSHLLATFTVTSTADSGAGSLRDAITSANANGAGLDTIAFNITGAGPHTITLASALPVISGAVNIDATTEPDFAGSPVVEVRGGGTVGTAFNVAAGGAGSTIRGLVVSGFTGDAIVLAGGNNLIAGNYIGTNAAGTAAAGTPNAEGGIRILTGSDNNVIGGTTAPDRNIIAGNGVGSHATDNQISLHGASNQIIGNYIGVAADGATVISSANDGIDISTGAANNSIGGTGAGEGNLIAGQSGGGVRIQNGASGSSIEGNTIWGNGSGVSISGASTGHTIQQNSIYGNTGIGIDLGSNGATANDANDADTGPNAVQNTPFLVFAGTTGTSVSIAGTLDTNPAVTNYRIEFFAGTALGNGEGHRYLGFTNVTTDGAGHASFDWSAAGSVLPGEYITATATNLTTGDTSEFSTSLAANRYATSIVQTGTAITVDGTLDAAWASAERQDLRYPVLGGLQAAADHSSQYRTLWDASYLYVLVEVNDSVKVSDSGPGNPWEDDIVEIMIDGDHARSEAYAGDVQYGFRWGDALNTVHIGSYSIANTTGVLSTYQDTATGTRYEVAIPWARIGISPTAGSQIGIDVSVGDDDDGGTRESTLSWAPSQDAHWWTPRGMGTGTLVATSPALPYFEQTGSAVTIDGSGADAVWSTATGYTVGNQPDVGGTGIWSTSDLSATWQAAWDATNVYFLVDVTDDILISDSATDWDDDTIEIFLDTDYSHSPGYDTNDFQLLFERDVADLIDGGQVATGPLSAASLTAGEVTFRMVSTAGGYRLEASVPWAEIGLSPALGDQLGFDVHVDDDDGGGTRDGKLSWSQFSDNGSTTPTAFGLVQLGIGSNAAPALSGANNLTAINEDPGSNLGTLVSALIAGQTSDANGGALTGIAVTAVDNTNGTWEYSTNGGSNWVAFGSPNAANARLLGADASTYVRFVPNANWNGTVAGGITFHAWDQTTGTAGGTADTSSNGGATAFSSATGSASITVNAVNDAPVNTVPGAQITSTNTPVVFSSANANAISISDGDAGAGMVQVTLTGTNGASTLSSTAGLTFSVGDGTGDAAMALTGTVADINAALNGLSFTPTTGFSGAASLQVATDDQGNAGSGGAQTDTDTIAITVDAGAPIAADNAYAVDEDGTLTVGWWDTDWTRRSQITFAGNTFGGAENLTDFPVLVTLTSANIDYAQTQNQGQDLRFLDGDGTPLAYEIESWNESGTSYVWVSVPQIDTTGTDSIWMYYGNAAAPAGQDAAAVWTGGYEAVYHLSESGATIADAAGAVDGTAVNGAAAATGFIAGARDLDGVDDHVNLGSDVPLLTSVSGATLSAWVNLDVIAAGIDQGLISISVNTTPPTGISRAALEVAGEEVKLIGRSLDSGADAHSLFTTGGALAGLQGAWHQLTGVVDYANDSFAIYLDGVLIQSASAPGVNFTNTSTDGTPSTNAAIGSGDEGVGLFADGRLDEMRIAGVARSAAWVRAEYLSMTGGLVSVGAAQNAPAAQGVLGNDSDPQDDALTATLVSGPANAASFTLNADGTFTYVPVADFAGSDTFTYTASDGANTSNTATVTITVNPVNDEPSFVVTGNQTVNEDAGAQTVAGFATPAPGGGADEAGQTFTYSVGNSNNALFSVQPTVDASGTLTFTAAAGAFGTATVTVSVTDSGGTAGGGDDTSASQVFTITVNPVADTPSVTNASTNEDTQTAAGLVISRNASDSTEVTHFKVTGITGGALYLNDGTTAVADGSFITFAQANAGLKFTPASDSTADGSFQVQASTSNVDAGLGGGLATATITVNAVNDAPVVASLGGDALPYQEGDGALVIEQGGDAAVTDVDSADFDTGVLTVTITAGGQPAEDALSVRNQGVGVGQIGFLAGSVTYQGVTIGTAAGGSAGTPLSISLNASATPAAVGALLRNITYENTDTLNATAGARTVSFVVTDGDGGTSLAQTTTVTVSAVNAAPVAVDDAAGTDEDTALIVAASGVLGNDSDPESGALTVTAVNGSAVSVGSPIALASGAVLTLNADGSFTYDPNGAFESLDAGDSTTDSFTYQVSDPGGANDTATVTINLSGVADAPATAGISNVTVDEDAPATVIDLFAAFADAEDADASLTYTVQANSNPALFGAVTVNGAAGTLTLDYTPDANGSAVLTVRATDTSGAFVESTFTVTVNAVNDAPALTLGANQSIAEDAGPQSAAGFAVATPGGGGDESAQTFAYSVTNSNNALFSVQPTIDAAGNLTYTAAADTFGTATVSVTLSDSGGTANGGVDTAALQTFTITVTPVNDMPTTAGIADITVDEDAPASVIDLFATFADLEDADAALTYTVQSNSNPALFSSVVVNAGAGTLALDHAADLNGTATLVVRATDTGGDFVESTFNVTVNPVNDAPILTLGGNQTVAEDAGAQGVSGFGSAAAGGGADEASQTFTYTVTNSNNALFTAQPTIDAAGNLAYTAAPDASGTATVTVVLSDSGGTANGGSDTAAGQTFTITVTPVNDVPTTAGIGDVTVNEDAANTIVDLFAAFADVEDADAALTYTVQSNSNPALFSAATVNGGLGTLNLGYAADMNGASTLVVRATDTAGDFVDAAFTVTVIAVNDAPVLTIGANQTVVEDAGPQGAAGFATAAAGGGADEAVQTLSYTLSNSNSALFSVQPTIDAAGNLTFTAAPDASGSATVTVSLADSGGTANGGVDAAAVQTFTITVTPVNDAPALTANALTITQGGRVTLTAGNVAATDADNAAASLLFTVSNVLNGQFELASAPTVAVTSFTQAQVAAGQVVFVHSGSAAPAYRVQVSDGALTDGPAAANVAFSAIVIVEEPDSPPPPPPELPPEVEPPPAASAPELPEEPLPEPPPVFSPGRPDSMDSVMAETITQLKRAEARQLTKVVQPVLSLNDYEPPPPVDVVMELLHVSPAQLEYQGSTPADWVIANAFTEGFQDEAQQQLEILLDSVRFGGMALSVGMVWWASRISAMLGSLLASAPAWRNIDPLPVLGGDDEEEKDKWLDPDDRDADANELAVALVLEGGRAAD